MITRQEAFDRALAHLRVQRVPAIMGINKTCCYRTPEGLKCAIGALIPDEKYSKDMEGRSANSFVILDAIDGNKKDCYFYSEMQIALHDSIAADYEEFPRVLEERAEVFAQDEGLIYAP